MLVAVENAGLGGLGGLDRQRPGAMLDTGCDVARESIGFGGFKVHIFSAGFGVEVVERVLESSVLFRKLIVQQTLTYHSLDFTSIGVHTSCSLSYCGVSHARERSIRQRT